MRTAAKWFRRLGAVSVTVAAIVSLVAGEPAAQTTQRIAAIVNDEIISGYDLRERTDLVILSSQLPNNPEVRERIQPQVLRTLIDDRLRLQEARRLDITVSEQEIEGAVREIEQRNQMQPGQMYALLDRNDIDRATFRLQLEADLAWRKIVGNQVRSSVTIGDEAIEDAMARIEENKGKPEYLISEIYLSVNAEKSAEETRELAERLHRQISQGANFSALAQSFSQSASAANGGNVGWVRADQLDPTLAEAAKRMKPGDISVPLKSIDGFYILQLRSKRTSQGLPKPDQTLTLQQVYLPLDNNAGEDQISARKATARNAVANATSCDAMEEAGKQVGSPQSGRLNGVSLASLPEAIRETVEGLEIDRPSEPIEVDGGIVVLMVCERQSAGEDTEAQERIRNMLINERAELIARRLMRDLHRGALVDIRR